MLKDSKLLAAAKRRQERLLAADTKVSSLESIRLQQERARAELRNAKDRREVRMRRYRREVRKGVQDTLDDVVAQGAWE